MTNIEAKRYIESCHEYTNEYEHGKLVKDWADKDRIAKKIVADFKNRAGSLAGKSLLDAGFGNGAFAAAFAEEGAVVSGIEVNPVLLDIAKEHLKKSNLAADLRLYDGHAFPFESGVFDYVYSTSVLEHVDDAGEFLQEISRVLKPGGRVYLSFPNRLAPKETHTGVWFLSYVPRSVAELFLTRVLKRNSIAELNLHFISYLRFMRLLRRTRLAVLYETGGSRPGRRLLKKLLAGIGVHQSALLKTVMVILGKR